MHRHQQSLELIDQPIDLPMHLFRALIDKAAENVYLLTDEGVKGAVGISDAVSGATGFLKGAVTLVDRLCDCLVGKHDGQRGAGAFACQ